MPIFKRLSRPNKRVAALGRRVCGMLAAALRAPKAVVWSMVFIVEIVLWQNQVHRVTKSRGGSGLRQNGTFLIQSSRACQ